LRKALSIDINELKKLCLQLCLNAAEIISLVSLVLDDEAMLEYQPSAKKKKIYEAKGKLIIFVFLFTNYIEEPCPVTFMQHKPHLNGLLIYLLACIVEHPGRIAGLPFILDFLPHLVVNDTTPDDTIQQFKDRWASPDLFPDLLGDAAFGSESGIRTMKTAGVGTLFSMPCDSYPYL